MMAMEDENNDYVESGGDDVGGGDDVEDGGDDVGGGDVEGGAVQWPPFS